MKDSRPSRSKLAVFLLAAIALLILPLVAQQFGNAWVRIIEAMSRSLLNRDR